MGTVLNIFDFRELGPPAMDSQGGRRTRTLHARVNLSSNYQTGGDVIVTPVARRDVILMCAWPVEHGDIRVALGVNDDGDSTIVARDAETGVETPAGTDLTGVNVSLTILVEE